MARNPTKPRKNFRRGSGSREKGSRIDFLKQVLTFFNGFFLLAGLGVLAVGIWTIVHKHHYASIFLSTTYAFAAYLLIAAGCVVVIAWVVGCMGIYKLRKSWMVTYILLLLMIFLIEAAAGVLAYLYADQMKSDLRTRLKEIVATEYGNDSSMSYSMDSLQSGMGCCGSLFFEDWSLSSWGKSPNILTNKLQDYTPVPDSCCKNTTAGCGYRSHPSNIYYDGCAESFAAFLREHLYIIGGVGIGFCAIQIFGAIISCCLVAKLNKPKEVAMRYDYTRAG